MAQEKIVKLKMLNLQLLLVSNTQERQLEDHAVVCSSTLTATCP